MGEGDRARVVLVEELVSITLGPQPSCERRTLDSANDSGFRLPYGFEPVPPCPVGYRGGHVAPRHRYVVGLEYGGVIGSLDFRDSLGFGGPLRDIPSARSKIFSRSNTNEMGR